MIIKNYALFKPFCYYFNVMIKKISLTILIIFIFSSLSYGLIIEPDRELLKYDPLIFDLRPLEDFKKERIKGSIHLDQKYFTEKLLSKDLSELITFLRIIGVNENSKIIFSIEDKDTLIKSAFISFFIDSLGVKNIYFLKGGIKGWKEKGLPTQTVGKSFKPSDFKPNFNENIVFAKADKNLPKQKNLVIINCDNTKSYIIKGSKFIDIELFFEEEHLLDKKKLLEELNKNLIKDKMKILLYPEDGVNTYAIAFLLKNYLEYMDVKILKGDHQTWLKLKILE